MSQQTAAWSHHSIARRCCICSRETRLVPGLEEGATKNCRTIIKEKNIKTNHDEGLDTFHAVVEATVQRSRPVVLTALAAVLAFIPLTFSVFWGSLAYTLIGETAVGMVLTLIFLPALCSI